MARNKSYKCPIDSEKKTDSIEEQKKDFGMPNQWETKDEARQRLYHYGPSPSHHRTDAEREILRERDKSDRSDMAGAQALGAVVGGIGGVVLLLWLAVLLAIVFVVGLVAIFWTVMFYAGPRYAGILGSILVSAALLISPHYPIIIGGERLLDLGSTTWADAVTWGFVLLAVFTYPLAKFSIDGIRWVESRVASLGGSRTSIRALLVMPIVFSPTFLFAISATWTGYIGLPDMAVLPSFDTQESFLRGLDAIRGLVIEGHLRATAWVGFLGLAQAWAFIEFGIQWRSAIVEKQPQPVTAENCCLNRS